MKTTFDVDAIIDGCDLGTHTVTVDRDPAQPISTVLIDGRDFLDVQASNPDLAAAIQSSRPFCRAFGWIA